MATKRDRKTAFPFIKPKGSIKKDVQQYRWVPSPLTSHCFMHWDIWALLLGFEGHFFFFKDFVEFLKIFVGPSYFEVFGGYCWILLDIWALFRASVGFFGTFGGCCWILLDFGILFGGSVGFFGIFGSLLVLRDFVGFFDCLVLLVLWDSVGFCEIFGGCCWIFGFCLGIRWDSLGFLGPSYWSCWIW